MADLDLEDCPFCYAPGEAPPPIEHEVIGVCKCGAPALAVSPLDGKSPCCFPCAYDEANW
jgi:hypothetical protein